MNKVHTSTRLRQLMDERGLKQIDILKMCEPYCKQYNYRLGKNDLSQYVSGKTEPGQYKLFILAKALNVNEAWLMGLDVPRERTESITPEKSNAIFIDNNCIYMVPIYESVSAGFGTYASDYITDYMPCYISNKTEADATLCIVVTGDSMYPKIENSDTIQVHKQSSVDSGSIAVVLIDKTEALVKKIVYGDDWIELHSINPMYPVQRFEGKDVLRIEVLGVVKKIIKNV